MYDFDAADRAQLHELLLEGVTPPDDTAREAMFEQTFASGPDDLAGDGADLLPPADLFDGGDEPDLASDAVTAFDSDADPFGDDAFADAPDEPGDDASGADDWSGTDVHSDGTHTSHDPTDDPTDADPGSDPAIDGGDPGTGW